MDNEGSGQKSSKGTLCHQVRDNAHSHDYASDRVDDSECSAYEFITGERGNGYVYYAMQSREGTNSSY